MGAYIVHGYRNLEMGWGIVSPMFWGKGWNPTKLLMTQLFWNALLYLGIIKT